MATEDIQNQVNTNTVLKVITGQSNKTTEEVANETSAVADAQDAVDEQKRVAKVAEQIQKNNDFFDPASYITPTAPTGDKLTNADFYPGLEQNVIQGYHQGKFFNSALVGSTNVAPMAVIEARKKELAQQAYTKAKNAEIARQKVQSFKVTAAPQFVSEINDRAMLYSQQMAKKYGNNYEALLKDPEYINTMRRFDEQGRSTLTTHERILKMQKDAEKGDLIISPEDAKFAQEYMTATGNLNAEHVANGIINGTFKATDFADRIQTYDNLKGWSTAENLNRFVREVKNEEFRKAPKGTYSKLEKLSVTDKFMDRDAHEQGLAQYVRDHKLYNAGNPDAPVGTPEHDKWVKFKSNQWEADKANGDKLQKEKSLVESGESARFSDNLAWMKHQDDKYNYYGEVEQRVTDKNRVVSFAQTEDATKRKADYTSYMKQFPTNKNNGYTTIQLGEPTNNKGTWSTNQAGITMKGGDGKFYTLSTEQIYAKGQDKVNGPKFIKDNKSVYEDAKLALKNKAGKSVVVSEEVGHFVRSSSGKWIPLELAGEGKHGDVTTMIIQKAKIVTGYKKVEDPNSPGVYTQEPIVSNSTFTITKPIGEEYEKANLLNHKATSSQMGAAKVY